MLKLEKVLTVNQLDGAKANTMLSDGRCLSLVIYANLNKSWIFRYTRPDGRRNWLGLGSYSDVSLSNATTKALVHRELVA